MIARIPRGPDIWADREAVNTSSNSIVQYPWYVQPALLLPPVIGVAVIPAFCAISIEHGLIVLSIVLGWTMLVGPCGRAHTCALTPPGCSPGGKRRWLVNTIAYTLAGMISGALVGALVALPGFVIKIHNTWELLLLVVAAVICVTRELGFLNWRLPEIRRQTRSRWFFSGPSFLNPMMWGLDVGLVFATWLSFSGAWLLALAVGLSGSPSLGATVFSAYWLGRALPHWIEPFVKRRPGNIIEFSLHVAGVYPHLRLIHALALIAFAIPLAWRL